MKELLNIQSELKAPKGQFNSFGKYKYRSAEDILEAVKPLCAKHNVILTLSDEMVLLGDRYYIKAVATIKSDNNSISVSAYAREAENKKGMDESQITGTASSYARKYALNGLFLIDDTKDADTDEHKHTQNNAPKHSTHGDKPEREAIQDATKEGLTKVMRRLENDENKKYKAVVMKRVCEEFGVDKWFDIKFDKKSYQDLILLVSKVIEEEKQLEEAGV